MSAVMAREQLFKACKPQATTNSFVQVSGSLLDVRSYPIASLAVRVANTGASNDLDYKVRGSIDGVNFTDVITLTLAGVEQAASGAAVQEDASAEVFITNGYDGGAPNSFNFYDVVVKSTVNDTPTTAEVVISAR